jgi:plasmid stabilization system protein ParE
VARVVWTDPALADLEAAADYIARDSPRQASLFVRRAFQATDRLETFPRSGRIVPEAGFDTIREILIAGYRIVYVISGSEILVSLVHHAARPLSADDLPAEGGPSRP